MSATYDLILKGGTVVNQDGEGQRAWHVFYVWALELVEQQLRVGAISPHMHALLSDEIRAVGKAFDSLTEQGKASSSMLSGWMPLC